MGDLVAPDPLRSSTCICTHSAERHVAQASSSVLDLTWSHMSWQTWIPTGTYLWRCHRIPGMVGYLIRYAVVPAIHCDMAVCYGAL